MDFGCNYVVHLAIRIKEINDSNPGLERQRDPDNSKLFIKYVMAVAEWIYQILCDLPSMDQPAVPPQLAHRLDILVEDVHPTRSARAFATEEKLDHLWQCIFDVRCAPSELIIPGEQGHNLISHIHEVWNNPGEEADQLMKDAHETSPP